MGERRLFFSVTIIQKQQKRQIYKTLFLRKSMAVLTLKGNVKIRSFDTEIDVPYKGEIITFVRPLLKVYDDYDAVMREIDSQNLLRPTTAQTLSLIDLAKKNEDDDYCKRIFREFNLDSLWTSTESLSLPEGFIVYDNIDGKMPVNRKSLMEKSSAKDEFVRFVPRGFKTGSMPISDFLKHPYIIAQVGEDMLETLERVVKIYNEKTASPPYLPDWIGYVSPEGIRNYTMLDTKSNFEFKHDSKGRLEFDYHKEFKLYSDSSGSIGHVFGLRKNTGNILAVK